MNLIQIFYRSKLCLIVLALCTSPVAAQVFDTGPSDPALFDFVETFPSGTSFEGFGVSFDDPFFLGGGGGTTAQFNISDGVNLGEFVEFGSGVEFNVTGGLAGFGVTAASGTEINLSGGSIFDLVVPSGSQINVFDGGVAGDLSTGFDSEVNISGGQLSQFFNSSSNVNITGGAIFDAELLSGSVVDFSGGLINNLFTRSGSELNASADAIISGGFAAGSGSLVSISGGSVDTSDFTAESGSEVNISGGSFFPFSINIQPGSEVNLLGSGFALDGVLLEDDLVIGEATTILDRDVTLSGLLADGSAFSFDLNSSFSGFEADFFSPSATLTVTLVGVPEPSSLALLGLGGVILFGRRRATLSARS